MIDAIVQAGRDLMDRLTTYGYTEMMWAEIKIELDGECRIMVYCSDDFQSQADSKNQVQMGYRYFKFEDGRFIIPEDFKTREQRELHFMTKQFGRGKEIADQMVSAAGRAFALKMEQELSSLRTMIAGPQE